MAETQVVIGVPGKWKNRTELIQAVASKSEGYLMAGYIIHNAKKDIGFQVEVYEHDPNLKQAFSYASRDTFDDYLLDEIEQHTYTVFNLYNLVEKPTFKSGETFSVGENSPIYRIQSIDDFRYEEDDIFFNASGLFDLIPV